MRNRCPDGQSRPRCGLQRQIFVYFGVGVQGEKIVGLDKIQGSLVQAMNYTYYRKYPDQDKRGVFTAFHKQYMETYKEEYGQPATVDLRSSVDVCQGNGNCQPTVTDASAIVLPAPKPSRGEVTTIYPNNDVLKNGLMVGAPEFLLEVKEMGTVCSKNCG